MDREKEKISGGRLAIACLIAVATALLAPVVLMVGAFSGTMLIVLPAVILPFLYGFGGKRAYTLGALIVFVCSILLVGTGYACALFCAAILPSLVMVRGMSQGVSFDRQLPVGIGITLAGTITGVLIASLLAGGNLIEWLYALIQESLSSMPEAYTQMLTQSLQSMTSASVTADEALSAFAGTLNVLMSDSKVLFPASIFGGAIFTAVFDVAIVNRMRARRGIGAKGCYLPVSKWHLPSGMTAGLLLILAISYVLYATGFNSGEAVLYTVLNICECAFSCSALGMIARTARRRPVGRGLRIAGIILFIAIVLLGGAMYIAIFGAVGAMFGSVVQRKRNNRENDSDDSDDSNEE